MENELNKNSIKAIVFDFGAVLINIDYQKTIDEFAKLGITNFELFFSKAQQNQLFNLLETGLISITNFYKELATYLPKDTPQYKMEQAWNAMLLDLPKRRIDFIYQLNKKYSCYLLSNTNGIHANKFFEVMESAVGKTYFHQAFNGVYLSHQIGLRKPEPEIFNYVTQSAGLKPYEILFIDDSPQHIVGAEKFGWQTIHLQANEDVVKVLQFLV